ncbi:M20/M25/M40 family metallo-hydrolase [Hufsiella ginkgonis]|uniref:Carboxypeptidase Q n=1 Tax=Hufsiella ginkgonis TaxID=2695274 RepID=A0A7K1XSK0_9SPHI|nr:M20/M25/M40 family metallo-hydrolase [Hufsiella ginkgonis]MXV13944.1 M20/M25/M40 family metallo-hydrolase [Hufsiella ginkgonis]
MKVFRLSFLFLLLCGSAVAQNADSVMFRKLFDEALVNGNSYQNLEYLCKKIGPRLSGSANAQKAVEWTKKLMEGYGFDRVYLQEVMVPHWVRGEKETAKILVGKTQISVPIAALGMSVGTPKAGVTAEVVEVQSLAELAVLGEKGLKGKIVFFNRAFDPKPIETGIAYGGAGDQRRSGPTTAAKYGAVGAIVRSLTGALDDYPHTGTTLYLPDGKNIPCAAISTKGANRLSTLIKSNPSAPVKFYFKQTCQHLADVLSYNVVGELKGSDKPEEIITIGGHLDSWDLAEGAHDDGTGVMQSVEVLRILKATGYKPKKTVRAVMFMNEENGARGGKKYAEEAKRLNEKHIAAIESDEGGFTPRGFSFQSSPALVRMIKTNWQSLLEPYQASSLTVGASGTDIEPLGIVPGVVLIGFRPDSQRYFDIHHTPADVFENVNRRELELGGAAIASLVYLIDQHGFPKN